MTLPAQVTGIWRHRPFSKPTFNYASLPLKRFHPIPVSVEVPDMPATKRHLRDLAIRLLSETKGCGKEAAAACVLERLDVVLSRIAGQAGSHSLLQRALALAQNEAPTLAGLRIPATGPITGAGWDFACTGPFHPQNDQVVLVAQVLELLQTFIGTRLTLQLVKEAWPHLDLNSGMNP
jgi:hypothetical protein